MSDTRQTYSFRDEQQAAMQRAQKEQAELHRAAEHALMWVEMNAEQSQRRRVGPSIIEGEFTVISETIKPVR